MYYLIHYSLFEIVGKNENCKKKKLDLYQDDCCHYVKEQMHLIFNSIYLVFFLLDMIIYSLCIYSSKFWFCSTGQIGDAIAPMIARGIMLGPNQLMILHLLDIAPATEALNGVKMELLDAAFPLLKGVSLILRANSR